MIGIASPRLLAVASAAGLMAAGGVLGSSWATAGARGPNDRPHLPEYRIVQIAERAAAQAGDPRPTLIQHSEGTRHGANLVSSGDGVPGRRWSYLIAERGNLILKDASVPSGARAPSGSVLTMIVDAATGRVTDGGVSDRYPHLATLGPVTTDLRQLPPGCLHAAPAYLPAERWSPARKRLAPPGANMIELCRYGGLNAQPPLVVDRMRLLRAARVVSGLVHQFGMLPPPPQGPTACPSEDRSQIIALLGYPDGHAVTISVGLTGCETVTNGTVWRAALGFGSPSAFGPQLVSHLKRLLAGGVTPSETLVGPRLGVLTGAIRFAGGPWRPRRPPIAGEVTVSTPTGMVAREHVRNGHDFRFVLAPGRYKLPGPRDPDCRPSIAIVRPAHTTRVNVDTGCSVP